MINNRGTCFNCGNVTINGKCNFCKYTEYELECPRKKGIMCSETKRLCKCKNWEECITLRKND